METKGHAGPWSQATAAEIRYAMARADMTQRDLATRMRRPRMWITRRLSRGTAATSHITMDDLVAFARALGVSPRDLIPTTPPLNAETSASVETNAEVIELPRLDSNQQPFGYQIPNAA